MTLILDPQILLKELQQLQAAGNHESMLVKAQQGIQAFPEQDIFLELLHYAQAHYVDEKLHSDLLQKLEAQKDYLQLYKVYKKLLEVFPDSNELGKLMHKVERKLKHAHTDERGLYIAKAKAEVQKKTKEGQLEEAWAAVQELDDYAPYDRSIRRLLRKVKHKRERALNKAMDEYFETHSVLLEQAFKLNQSDYINV